MTNSNESGRIIHKIKPQNEYVTEQDDSDVSSLIKYFDLQRTYRKVCVRFFISVIGVFRNGLGDPYGDSLSDSATIALANAKSSSFIVNGFLAEVVCLFYCPMEQQNNTKSHNFDFTFVCQLFWFGVSARNVDLVCINSIAVVFGRTVCRV